jgi:hypothetical protein
MSYIGSPSFAGKRISGSAATDQAIVQGDRALKKALHPTTAVQCRSVQGQIDPVL